MKKATDERQSTWRCCCNAEQVTVHYRVSVPRTAAVPPALFQSSPGSPYQGPIGSASMALPDSHRSGMRGDHGAKPEQKDPKQPARGCLCAVTPKGYSKRYSLGTLVLPESLSGNPRSAIEILLVLILQPIHLVNTALKSVHDASSGFNVRRPCQGCRAQGPAKSSKPLFPPAGSQPETGYLDVEPVVYRNPAEGADTANPFVSLN